MLILLNSTKTMDLRVKVPARLTPTRPAFLETAAQLAKPLAKVEAYRLEMGSKVKPKGPVVSGAKGDHHQIFRGEPTW